MKVSAIIPVYNGSKYLAATLESALTQTRPVDEFIVIDDGSTDSSPEILKSYGDRLKVIRQHNQGIAATRNLALRLVTGDVITFLDQDDLWPADRTQVMVEALQATPSALVAAGLVEILYERVKPPTPLDNFGIAHREFYLGSLCIRRQVFDMLGPFHTGVGYADDVDFLMRRREAGIVSLLVDVVTLRYRLHETNTSRDRRVTNDLLMTSFRESLKRRRQRTENEGKA